MTKVYIVQSAAIQYNDENYYFEDGENVEKVFSSKKKAQEYYYKKYIEFLENESHVYSTFDECDDIIDRKFCIDHCELDKNKTDFYDLREYLENDFSEKFKKLPLELKKECVDKIETNFFSIIEMEVLK